MLPALFNQAGQFHGQYAIVKSLERFSFVCTVSTDHRQAIAEADWHGPRTLVCKPL
jgi:hypothetical protein